MQIHKERNTETMNTKLHDENVDFLFDAILTLKNREECYKFFEDLCTCLLYTSDAADEL